MCIEPSQLHHTDDGLRGESSLDGDCMKNGSECAYFDGAMKGNGDAVRPRLLGSKNYMGTHLAVHIVAHATKCPDQFVAIDVARKFHAATSRTRSSSIWSRMREGRSVTSPKWHATASRTIASRSSHVSPCVAINPSATRQLAVNPPSSAGQTLKTISRSIEP